MNKQVLRILEKRKRGFRGDLITTTRSDSKQMQNFQQTLIVELPAACERSCYKYRETEIN